MGYALSADGYAVVRSNATSTVAAALFNSSLLTNGFTASTKTGGTLSLTNYTAGFRSGTGGTQIRALYSTASTVTSPQMLQWVQIITTNDPLKAISTTYLDNSAASFNPNAPTQPFYSATAVNRTAGLPSNQLNFFDFSTRSPADLATLGSISWTANLFPVLWDGGKSIQVDNGLSWGWTMKKAMVGWTSGTFVNPAPGTATVSGASTGFFTWGQGQFSSLSFAGALFDTKPNTKFKLGTLTFHNGSITGGTGADSVVLDIPLHFDNVPEKDFSLKTTLKLINTPNNSDPIASADRVVVGSSGYTFNVQEGMTASVDIYATLSTGLSVASLGTATGAAMDTPYTLDPAGDYTLSIVGLSGATSGGFYRPAFSVYDRTQSQGSESGGTPFSGPVSGVEYQYVDASANDLNITAGMDNVFIHTGSGTDAIDVSGVEGRNVLDGGTNSNFLVGSPSSSSYDTFFVDDRSPPSDIWSTVANFKAGDDATVFGVNPNDFQQSWDDNQGATGYTGLTVHFAAAGKPTASLTLAGFSKSDLGNGRLTTSFGTLGDGTTYFYVHGNA